MIRIKKNVYAPQSLGKNQTYNAEDVRKQLLHDQNEKCYLCERILGTDFEVEHLKSQTHHPELKQEWNNLLLACRYCNNKKTDSFDNILHPLFINIEEEIVQQIDFSKKEAVFCTNIIDEPHNKTIELLNRIFNGNTQLRKIKERFFEYVISIINRFQQTVNDYLMNPTPENAQKIRNELNITQELLGFKYWIIRNNSTLYQTFGQDIIWNKPSDK